MSEVLTVNKDKLQETKQKGFELKENNLGMKLAKIPKNLYKVAMTLLLAAEVTFNNVLGTIPGAVQSFDFVKNIFGNIAGDKALNFLWEKICYYKGLGIDFNNFNINHPNYADPSVQQALTLWNQLSNINGDYYWVGLIFKTVVDFAFQHPALVLAGGLFLAKAVTSLVSLIARKIKGKIHNTLRDKRANNEQKEIYQLLDGILKKHRYIKKSPNGQILLDDLMKIEFIVDKSANNNPYLQRIKEVLQRLSANVEDNNKKSFDNIRIELESIILDMKKKGFITTHKNELPAPKTR